MAVIQGYIIAMSIKKKDAIRNISAIADILTEHIVKLLLFKKHTAYKHWVKETDAWLRTIARMRLKPDNKPLKAGLIYRELTATAFMLETDGNGLIDRLIAEHPKLKVDDPSISDIQRIVKQIYKEFADMVEQRTFKESSSIKDISYGELK